MLYLIAVSFLWAFSFGLVKNQLSTVDSTAVAAIRMAIALLVFLPFLRFRKVPAGSRLRLALVGAIQFGAMYVLYLHSYRYLMAHEVVLFTVLTPLYIVLIDAALTRRWCWLYLVAAVVAAAGSTIILEIGRLSLGHLKGFVFMQVSNLCFAIGQLAWRREHERIAGKAKDWELFGLLYAGGLVASAGYSLVSTNWSTFHLTGVQTATVIYLGIVPAGLCFYWWNVGAEKVSTGTLAVMNNVKLPIAVAVSLLVFGEKTNLPRLLLGAAVLGVALWLADLGKRRIEALRKAGN